MAQRIDSQLMKVGDSAFWDEFEEKQNPADRYIVVDTKKQEIVVQNAKLVREMKKIRV